MTVLPPIQSQSIGALTPGLFDSMSYDVYMEINPNTLTYLLYNYKLKKVDYLAEYQATSPYQFSNLILLNQTFMLDKMLEGISYHSITISSSLHDYQIVPQAYPPVYDDIEKWTRFESLPLSEAQIQHQQDTQVLATLKHYFSEAIFTHTIKSLLQHIVLNKYHLSDQLVLDFSSRRITIIVFKSKTLQLINTYDFSVAEDVIYYLQLVFVQFHFDQLKTPILLSGEIVRGSIIYNELIKYYDAIQLVQRNSAIVCNSAIAELSSSYYFSLIGNIPCEL
jgi:hypothetical protein